MYQYAVWWAISTLLFVSSISAEYDIDECGSNPCLNGGTCQQEVPGEITCMCELGFTGSRCENENWEGLQNLTAPGEVAAQGTSVAISRDRGVKFHRVRGRGGNRGPGGRKGPGGRRGPGGKRGPGGRRGPGGKRGPGGRRGPGDKIGPGGKRGHGGKRGPGGRRGRGGRRGHGGKNRGGGRY